MRSLLLLAVICLLEFAGIARAQGVVLDEQGNANLIYDLCVNDKMQFVTSEQSLTADKFCRCFGDYLASLMEDGEQAYVKEHFSAPPSLIEKEQRANELCRAMIAP